MKIEVLTFLFPNALTFSCLYASLLNIVHEQAKFLADTQTGWKCAWLVVGRHTSLSHSVNIESEFFRSPTFPWNWNKERNEFKCLSIYRLMWVADGRKQSGVKVLSNFRLVPYLFQFHINHFLWCTHAHLRWDGGVRWNFRKGPSQRGDTYVTIKTQNFIFFKLDLAEFIVMTYRKTAVQKTCSPEHLPALHSGTQHRTCTRPDSPNQYVCRWISVI